MREEFEKFLLANGLTPDHKKGLIADGSIGRAFMDVDGKQKLTGWYQVWLDQSVPFGRCGDYRFDANAPMATWKPSNASNYKMTDKDRAEIAELAEKAKEEAALKHAKAAKKAGLEWAHAIEFYNHKYLTEKGVKNHGLKASPDGNVLLVPMLDENLDLAGIQYINDVVTWGPRNFFMVPRRKAASSLSVRTFLSVLTPSTMPRAMPQRPVTMRIRASRWWFPLTPTTWGRSHKRYSITSATGSTSSLPISTTQKLARGRQ
jgi:hypothetical protein